MKGKSSHINASPFIARFLSRLPRDVASTFTPEQLRAVQLAFGMRYAMSHLLDMRRTVRLPWGRFYLVLLAGRDERNEGPEPDAFRTYLLAAAGAGLAGALLTLLA